jgi:hypothetical protein
MSCWRRTIGSDDLKEEKLLEETERVRGGSLFQQFLLLQVITPFFLPQQLINVSFQSLP